MKVLVTGGLGFIGSNFIIYLTKKFPKLKITNLDAYLPGSNVENIETNKIKNYSFIRCNINNREILDKVVSKSDIILNFAAESHVDRSIKDPKPFINSNILGVYSILEAVRKYKKRLIQISTDEVFGSLKKDSATEDFLLNPSSPYAASKASAEMLVNSYIKTYDCNAIITRCTNNFGPRQSPEKLIPKVILRAEQDLPIPIFGTGKNIRDWIYVSDHCDAILKVMFEGEKGESYNISSGNELDNITLVKKILKLMGKSNKLIHLIKDRPGHDFRYSLNSQKIYHKLHWKSTHNFQTSLEDTINWYDKNEKWIKNSLKKINL
jgi:dTDP-glucose 4,6-dehydratase